MGPDNAIKKWVVDCKVKPPVVIEMGEGNVDVEMTMKDSDFIEIVTGKLRPDQVNAYLILIAQCSANRSNKLLKRINQF
ncbi:hypothetical protein X798_07553 [Onchocerca flexuosa]|uniref:SCP2 domain-containing protein n=1 Tax=Onchocerca flexuosa TaxID=387005 RepID=A0A238BJU8_9BILA|nr:hypothetical protein X798_07553 [Onchocerca flexuosa]